MFKPFKRKASPRRQAIREDLAEIGIEIKPSRRRARQMGLVIAAFWVLAALLQFWPRNPMPYRVNEKSPMEIRAKAAFEFKDPVVVAQARELSRRNAEEVLSVNEAAVKDVYAHLVTLRHNADAVSTAAQLPDAQKLFPSLDENHFDALRKFDVGTFDDLMSNFRDTILEGGIRSIPLVSTEDRDAMLQRRQENHVSAPADTAVRLAPTNSIDPKRELPSRSIDDLLVVDEHKGVDPALRGEIRNLVGQNSRLSEALADLVTDCLMNLKQPIYRYDKNLSDQLATLREESFMPHGPLIPEGEVIVARGQVITPVIYQELLQSEEALEQKIAQEHPWSIWLNRLGLVLTVLILTGAGAVFVHNAAPKMTIRRAWVMAGLFWITLAAAKVIVMYSPFGLLAIAPTLLVAIILVIAENPRFALGMAAVHGLLATLTLREGVEFYVPLMTGSAIFCFGLGEIRTRGKLIEVGAAAGFGILAAVWGLGLSRLLGLGWSRWIGTTDIDVIFADSLWGAGAGVGVAMFALAILPSIERIFKITTAMTLLELCDANKPLMRRLSQEAAGTFNHSLTVGIMAEAAGNAIGANGLLCRVGAYYHDVGKLSKPQYFIENQAAGRPNRHDKLSPAMSLLIIVGHVKDGIELAREYGLPWVVHQFIGQHHGTTLVEYFFHAARKRAEQGTDGPVVSEAEFRYPGPKPQTREAAIVMICDGCESVVRSIEEPTAGRIETAVHNMITKRLMDGQFNECDLTLRELSVIEETLVRTLAGIHHGRVAYPGGNKTETLGDDGDVISQPA